MLILVAGLPRAGKSSFADAVEAHVPDYTHVPLDKYICEVPPTSSFLDWVNSPRCIDWPLLHEHLDYLRAGYPCYTPLPDWSNRGQRTSAGGLERGGRLMQPARRGYVIPGSYAFRMPLVGEPTYKIFIHTPPGVIAERLVARSVLPEEIEPILDQHLSPNWREIQGYIEEASLVLSGLASRSEQLQQFLSHL
jgi:uridine kinase